MRKFSKQIMLIALGLIVCGSLATQARAGKHKKAKASILVSSNCSPSANGPLESNSSYAFQAFGADSSAVTPGHSATSTLVGSFITDGSGCPTNGFVASNDNGFVCQGTFTSKLTENASPPNTGVMVWTVSQTTMGCLPTITLNFDYANASDFSDVMYLSSNGADVFTFAGKIQENQ